MQPLNPMGEGPQGPSADVASDSSRLSDDQWARGKDIFHHALERPAAGRKAFIREACKGDAALEAALESLLASDDSAREFLETPAVARVGLPSHPTATLAPRDRLGAYQIVALIGAGGMGEVYRARDARLERDVALKVLPAQVMNDTVRRQWLTREAQAAAALDHPHICPIFDIGDQDGRVWIAMQFVEGETLAERLKRGPLELPLALDVATQIAGALSAAHCRGIVHRDVKPENIMIAASGQAKVLDFGLAKVAAEHGTDTLRSGRSGAHSRKLGTLPYMSPEQLRGESLDARTDVFSLSVVLYEMIAGRRPFAGDGDEELRTCILSVAPLPVTSLVAAVDPALNRITQRGLQKDRAARYQAMSDLAADLEDLKRRLERRSQRIGTRTWVTRGALAAIVVGLIASLSSRQQTTSNSTGPLQYVQLTNFPDSVHSPALSRDGKMLAFVRGREPFQFPGGELYIKALPDGQPVALTHDYGTLKMAPAFTPDGSRIVFTSTNWSSWTIPVAGGSPTLFRPNAASLRWTSPGDLLFSAIKKQPNMGIVAVSESRGTTRDVYVPASGGMAHFSERSPDGKWVLVVEMDINGWLPCRLVPFDGSSSGRQVGPPAGACTSAAWSPDGQWMYFIATVGGESHLWRQPAADGSPQQLTFGPNEERGVAVDPDGLSVITSVGAAQSTVWYHDASGDRSVSVEGYAYRPSLSSDRRKVFYLIRRGAKRSWSLGELWETELATGRTERILPDFLVRSYHVSRDGNFVAFDAFDEKDLSRVWVAAIDGSQPPRRLTPDGGVEEQRPFFGANNIYFMQQQAEAKSSLYRVRPDGSGRQKLSVDEFGFLVNISPDEKWAALWNMGGERGGTWLIPLASDAAYQLCICGMGPIFQSSPMVSWSGDNETMFVNAGNQGGERAYRARGTVAIPWRGADTVPAGARLVPSDLGKLRGALRIPEASVAPGRSTETYAFTRQSEQRNLYRIRLP